MVTLFKGTAQIIIDPSGSNIIISRDAQVSPLTITPMKDTQPLNSQGSSQPLDFIQTGVTFQVDLSIGDTALFLQMFALAYETTVQTSTTKKRVDISDIAGTRVAGYKMVIKPYAGLNPSTDANTWITLPYAKVQDLQGTNLTYGLTQQQELKMKFMAMPDPSTNVKIQMGDTSF